MCYLKDRKKGEKKIEKITITATVHADNDKGKKKNED